ncbi:sialidase family protein [Kribbella sp. NPDC056345]|uniref:sialidase family protein n=1 Tax=Kribbella sp. NPDC056345 TaxID=3345789 RepID=UPI0035DD068F
MLSPFKRGQLALALALVAAPLAAVPATSAAAEPVGVVRAYEVEPVGGVPSGCTTPAGKGAAVVSGERGVHESQRSLLVNDVSGASHTVVVCPLDPAPSTALSFSVYPATLQNGFLVSLNGRWQGGAAGTIYHLNVLPSGSIQWYDGTRWTPFAAAGTVPIGAWSNVRIEAGSQSAQVFVGGQSVGAASRAGSAGVLELSSYQFGSNGTVPEGDRVFFDDVQTTAGRGFESEAVGAVPAGCFTPAGKAAAVVSDLRAFSGERSLQINDRATTLQNVISCPSVPQRGIDLKIAAYPAALENGFLVSLRGHFEGQAGEQVVFHLAIQSDGSLRWYDGAAWTTVSPPGAVRVGAWNQLGVRVASDQEEVQLTVNGVRQLAGGPWGMRRVTDITGFDLSSNGTAPAGDEVFFDDISGLTAPAAQPPAAISVGQPVTIEQANGSLLQMPHASANTGSEALVTYAAHADATNSTGTRFATSADQGTSWRREDARNPFPNEQSYNLSTLRNGDVLALSYHTFMRAGNRSADVETKISHDGGKTWGPVRVGAMTTPQTMKPISSTTSRPGRTMGGFVLVHSVIEDPDGTMYLSAYGYYDGDTRYRQLILRSTDSGLNWSTQGTVAYNGTQPGEGFCEAGIQRVADGSLLAVMRTGWYLNMYVARSTDNGRTWTTPTVLKSSNGVPTIGVYPSLVLMPDNRLVLYYGRPGQSVMISDDGSGHTWSPPTYIDYRNSANGSLVPTAPNTLLAFGDRGANWSVNKPPTAAIWSRTITLPPRS